MMVSFRSLSSKILIRKRISKSEIAIDVHFRNALTNRRVPLHKPPSGSRFLNKIIDANRFKNHRSEGIPSGV